MILLDTHVFYWLDQGEPRIGDRSDQQARAAWRVGGLAVSAVTFWEIALLVARGRLALGLSVARWRSDILEAGIVEIALDGAAAALAVELAALLKDPADRFMSPRRSCTTRRCSPPTRPCSPRGGRCAAATRGPDGSARPILAAPTLAASRRRVYRPAAPGSLERKVRLMSHTLHPLRRQRLHRSELAVPASNPGMVQKAADSAADVVFLDLEDAVAPPEKPQARKNAIEALRDIDWAAKGKTVSVRINGLDTHYMYRDVVDVMEQAGDRVHTLLVPKVGVPADLYMVDALVNQIEQAKGYSTRVGLEALIETALGMANVEEIARFGATLCPRLEALHFGVADYTASMRARTVNIGGLNPDYPGDQWHASITRMVIACRAYGLRAIDGPFGDFSDPDGYRAAARRAAALGCEGKWAIHPSQVALANELFSPTEAEVTKARRIVEALREAEAQGKGAASLDGKMIDAASEKMANNVLAIAAAIANTAR